MPSEYLLYQNYPNPFNPSTKIKFSIPKNTSGITSLKLFDILGREVSTLINESLQAGTYEVLFDGSNLSSGIYFYKITSGDYAASRKMILLK